MNLLFNYKMPETIAAYLGEHGKAKSLARRLEYELSETEGILPVSEVYIDPKEPQHIFARYAIPVGYLPKLEKKELIRTDEMFHHRLSALRETEKLRQYLETPIPERQISFLSKFT